MGNLCGSEARGAAGPGKGQESPLQQEDDVEPGTAEGRMSPAQWACVTSHPWLFSSSGFLRAAPQTTEKQLMSNGRNHGGH